MDLATLNTSDEIEITIEMPDGTLLKGSDDELVTIRIVSVDNEAYKKVERRITDQRIARAAKKRNKTLSAAEIARDQIELVSACIVGWSDNVVWDGNPFGYSDANAKKLVETLPFIREQIDEASADRQRFFGN